MITKEKFYDHKQWERFSKTCRFRVSKGFHWPENHPDDACNYRDEKRGGGGVYANCCYTVCVAWIDQLSEFDKADILAEMDQGYREMERTDPNYHRGG